MTKFLLCVALLTTCGVASAAPKAEPATKPVKTIQELLAVVPRNIVPDREQDWTDIQLEACNEALKKTKGGPFRFTIHVQNVERANGKLRIAAVPNLPHLPVQCWFYFDDNQKMKLASLKKGDAVIVTGDIDDANLARKAWLNNRVVLTIEGVNCDVHK